MTESPDTWPHPVPLGVRLCWRWEGRNLTIPAVEVTPIHTDCDIDHGWHAELPTENGATVDLTWDPDTENEAEQLHLWLYVKHPDDGRLIEASLGRSPGHENVTYWIEYDPSCLAGECSGCEHGFGQWWEYVTDGPQHVMTRLAWLGSLPIKALIR